MDLSALVLAFATGTYTVTRRGPATTVVHGLLTPATATTLSIVASVSPLTGRDLERLPELRYDSETRALFTVTELSPGGQGATYQADMVTIDGEDWEVVHVETWKHPSGVNATCYRCIVQRP